MASKDPCNDPLLCKWGRVEVLGRKELPGHLAQTFRGEPKREQSPLSSLRIAALQREVVLASWPTDKQTDRQTDRRPSVMREGRRPGDSGSWSSFAFLGLPKWEAGSLRPRPD